jgi:hypothetical protein
MAYQEGNPVTPSPDFGPIAPAAAGIAPRGVGDLPRLLTPGEAKRALRVSDRTIRRMATDGRLRPIYLTPTCRRYRFADIARILTLPEVPS